CNKSYFFYRAVFVKQIYETILFPCFVLAVYGLLGYWEWLPGIGILHRNAGFDNPAGLAACLCAGFPISLYFLRRDKKWIKIMAVGIGLTIVIIIFLIQSRTGIFSLFSVGAVWLCQKKKININTT